LHAARGVSGSPQDSTAGTGRVAGAQGGRTSPGAAPTSLTWAAWRRLSRSVLSLATGQGVQAVGGREASSRSLARRPRRLRTPP